MAFKYHIICTTKLDLSVVLPVQCYPLSRTVNPLCTWFSAELCERGCTFRRPKTSNLKYRGCQTPSLKIVPQSDSLRYLAKKKEKVFSDSLSCVVGEENRLHTEEGWRWQCRKENKSDVFMLLTLRHLQIGSDTNGGLTLPGYRGSCLLLRPLPGIYTSDTHVLHVLWLPLLLVWKSKAQMRLILSWSGHFLRHIKPRTYWEEVPCDCRRGEASKHIVRAAEMSEVGAGHSLTSALTPH